MGLPTVANAQELLELDPSAEINEVAWTILYEVFLQDNILQVIIDMERFKRDSQEFLYEGQHHLMSWEPVA